MEYFNSRTNQKKGIDENLIAAFNSYVSNRGNSANSAQGNTTGITGATESPTAPASSPSSVEDMISALPLRQRAALYQALTDGDVSVSPQATDAKNLYSKAFSEAESVAKAFGKKPSDADYDSFVESYAREFYNEQGAKQYLSYEQVAEMDKTYKANQAKRKLEAFKSTNADFFANAFDKPEYTYNDTTKQWDWNGSTNRDPGVQQNQRWKDWVYHLSGQDEKVSSYKPPQHQPSYSNEPMNQPEYPSWFEEYYKNS